MPASATKQFLGSLVLPVYVPTVLRALGSSALLPLHTLIALRLGFSPPAAAAIAMIAGIVGVLGPVPAGRLMVAIGERVAMIASGVALVVISGAGFLVTRRAFDDGATWTHRIAYLSILLVSAIFQQVWQLGRQSYVGTRAPVEMRARALSMLGGMFRVGAVGGPLVAAAIVALADESWVFLLDAAMTAVATVLLALRMPPGENEHHGRDALRSLGRSPVPPDPSPHAPGRSAWATMLLVGLGIIPLSMSRAIRPVLVPLVGAAMGLDSAVISLLFGVAAAIEILLVVPAGTMMDRRGRAAVAVPCLAVSGVGYLVLALLQPSGLPAVAVVGLGAVLVAIGNGLGSGIVMTLGADLSPERMRTRHLARWNSISSVGQLAGPGLIALVTFLAPIWAASAATAAICAWGGAWLARILPGVTPKAARAEQ